MTMSGDLGRGDFEAPPYPSVFGITFTPIITGALAAILGLGAAVFLYITYAQPAMTTKTALESEVEGLKAQRETAQANKKKLQVAQTNLKQAEQRRQDVYALFASEDSLDTLLLDLNREATRPGRNIRLVSFTPVGVPDFVKDDSLGPAAKGKLKTQTINVSMEADFGQTQALIRSIERLQPLIIVRAFNATRDASKQKLVITPPAVVTSTGQALLKTTFGLQVVVAPSIQPTTPKPPGSPQPSPSPAPK